MRKFAVIVVGAGPGGLSCGRLLAAAGVSVLVVERKKEIGPKVCGGGITWDGLIRRVPGSLIRGSFRHQYLFSPWQRVVVREPDPIIATVGRRDLGRYMEQQARAAGARIRSGTRLLAVEPGIVTIGRRGAARERIGYDFLVGADGSASGIRKYLGVPTKKYGLGIDCRLPLQLKKMEWHFNPRLFGSGYGWIFPHGHTVSIGAYTTRGTISPHRLHKNLMEWGAGLGFDLRDGRTGAGLVNYDYRGVKFRDNIWLVGDAAGLASGLTGEGMYPAIVSGEGVAGAILGETEALKPVQRLAAKQALHSRVLTLTGRSTLRRLLVAESFLLLLRLKLLDFRRLEMAE